MRLGWCACSMEIDRYLESKGQGGDDSGREHHSGALIGEESG